MKALQLVPAMEEGGVERYATVLNRILVSGGWENVVVSRGGRLDAEIVRDGGRTVRLDLKSKNPLSAPLRAWRLRRLLLRERPDVVCAHSRVPAWLFRFASRGLEIPFLTFAHGANSVSRYSAVMASGDRVMCPSTFVADYLRKAYGTPEEKFRVVPHAIDAAKFDPEKVDRATVAALKSEWGLVPGAPVIMSVGRITRVKGLETLLEAFALVNAASTRARLVIVGGADEDKLDYLDSLKARARLLGLGDAVVFAGSRSCIPECLSLADVVVSANTVKPESFGLSMAEALAMGCPVVARGFGGALDIVRNGKDGVLISGTSPQDFADAIRRALALPRETLRRDALARFDYETMSRETLAVYGEAVAASSVEGLGSRRNGIIMNSKGDNKMMQGKMTVLLAVALTACAIFADEVKFTPIWAEGPTMGVNVNPSEANPWHAMAMSYGAELKPGDRVPLANDFFTAEYGAPAAFEFAKTPAKKVYEGVRFCRGWGRFEGSPIRVEMEVKQSVASTTWKVSSLRKDFEVKTKEVGKWEKVTVDFPFTRWLKNAGNTVTVECKTKDASVAVRNMKIYPCDVKLQWRAELELKATPHRAGVTYGHHDNYTFKINGKTVAAGTGVFAAGLHRKSVTEFFRAGKNVIEFSTLNSNGYAPPGLLMELFTVADDGTTTFLDETAWKVRIEGRDWTQPHFPNPKSRDRFKYGSAALANDKMFFNGMLPLHAGALAVTPKGEKYPVFDYDTGAVWMADVPPAVKDPVIGCIVSNALTGAEVERFAQKAGGGGASRSGVEVRLKTTATGAYLLNWTLRSGDRVIDRFENEMVVAGPLDQEIVPRDEVEPLLDKKLKLIQEVDCTKDVTEPDRFMDHISMWWTTKRHSHEKRPIYNCGRVTEEQGIRFRETGPCNGDWFGYKLDIKNLGKLHVVDVFYPETRDAYLFSGINENFPAPFCNNHAKGGNYYCNASGSVRPGWMTPKRAGIGRMRYVFWPGSKGSVITFENGCKENWKYGAGVCSFKVYEVDGRLPGMKLPKTDKIFGIHAERPLWAPWGASVNAVRRAGWSGLDRLAYAACFAGASHRVEYLRYAGINTAIEGLYMYHQGFPTDSGNSFHIDQDFDDMYVFAKLCKHNGLKLYGCYEYMSSPKLFADGLYDASERDVVAGRARGIQCINKDGHEQYGYPGLCLNPFAPEVRASVREVAKELHDRYAPTKAVDGLFVIVGGYWLPCFACPQGLGDVEDYGFEDWTVAQFEKETGIRLGVDAAATNRFALRAEKLLGAYRDNWFTWRSKKMKECFEELADACGDWKVIFSTQYKGHSWNKNWKADIPMRQRLKEAGFDPSLYPKDGRIRCILRRESFRSGWCEWSISNILGQAAMDIYRENGGAYLAPGGIEERPIDTAGVTRWWWRYGCNGVYDMKSAGDQAFFDVRKLVNEADPDIIVHKWTDCNYTTAHAEESRRALYDYYTKGSPKFGTWLRETLKLQ